jgi:hypothetical protein
MSTPQQEVSSSLFPLLILLNQLKSLFSLLILQYLFCSLRFFISKFSALALIFQILLPWIPLRSFIAGGWLLPSRRGLRRLDYPERGSQRVRGGRGTGARGNRRRHAVRARLEGAG